MTDFSIRMGVFLGAFLLLLWWQKQKPYRKHSPSHSRIWHNLLLFISGAGVVRLLQPLFLAVISFHSEQGLLQMTWLPDVVVITLSLVILDGVIYWQHRLFHTLPWLWRLHRVHHSDPALDTTSALRFHPVEILLSLTVKSTVILLCGIPFEAVLLFDILLNTSAMFNHTNVRIPEPFESTLRLIIVTPDYHRIHHSRTTTEANSNYGFCLSLWDRLFGSYTRQPHSGDAALTIGLPGTRRYMPAGIVTLLTMPFWSKRKEKREFGSS
ncbi:Fatty acid hydroxylase superfamily protein [Vibrio aerogenes CECT 7868]|uniref:Fatty acid hydroxylase superfamily protein n=1 Tax=Vibrio aerogenes CECT 7868 TaxID=1216006 RepID=A0A1M5Y1L8_9VIBR|nr:sterol desaturase family protein [Vibrio aerogenes]SHI05902.1 Fatty acid hydroxylase superfamily protein [Vibrio aerogenes CECT 7868]